MDSKKNIRLEVANDMYDVLRDIQDQRRSETGRKTSLAMIALEFLQDALENEELGEMIPKTKKRRAELNGQDHESMQSAENDIKIPPVDDNTVGEKPIVEMKEAELLIEEDGRILKFDDIKTLQDYYKMKKAQLQEANDVKQIQFTNSEYRRILSTQKGRILTIFSNEGLILMDAANMIDWDVLELDAILSDTTTGDVEPEIMLRVCQKWGHEYSVDWIRFGDHDAQLFKQRLDSFPRD